MFPIVDRRYGSTLLALYGSGSVQRSIGLPHEKALKCKPSALIFGRGRAKELLHVRDDLRKRTR